MGIRQSFDLICGIRGLPLDTEGSLRAQETFTSYPCFVPRLEDFTPLWEADDHVITLPEPERIQAEDIPKIKHAEFIRHMRGYQTYEKLNRKKLGDVFFWPSSDEGYGEGIAGYKIQDGPYADDLTYAFVSLDEKYAQNGFQALPTLSLEESGGPDTMALKRFLQQAPKNREIAFSRDYWRADAERGRMLERINRKKREFKNNQLYAFFTFEFEGLADVTMALFNYIGIRARRRDLRLMLVWHWS